MFKGKSSQIYETDVSENNKEEKPEKALLEAVLNNNTSIICTLIENNEHLVNYVYPENGKTILLVACSQDDVNAETVRALLDLNANPRDYTEDDGWETLHYAASNTNYDILKILLERHPDIINVVEHCDNNALHMLIRHGDPELSDFLKCTELLTDKGIDVNQKNIKNKTPIDFAVEKNLSTNIIEIMKNQIGKNILEFNDGRTLLEYLKQGNIDQFINFKDGKIEDLVDYSEDSHTLLQMCCEKNLAKAAIYLLNKGAKHELTSRKNSTKPILIAVENGNSEIFKALLVKYKQIFKIPSEVLPKIMQYIDREYHDNIGCYHAFMDKLKEIERDPEEVYLKLNERDEEGNTALHYAVMYAEPSVIEELLSLGAALGAKNKFGVMPISNMETEILKNHLDECVIFDLKKRGVDKEEFKVKFNYRTLIPPYMQVKDNLNPEAYDIETTVQRKLVAETEVLDVMSRISEFKELLKHPTITSFLYLKWLHIQWFFWINLICYVTFASSLLGYIFIHYANFPGDNSFWQKICVQLLHIIFLLGCLIIMLRELFQIFVAPVKYLMNIENYIEISLLVLSVIIAFDIFRPQEERKVISAIALLLISFELILLLGQHPKFSTNVVMLRTVSYNFYKFLIWYSLPIIAFAMSFSLVFSTDKNNITSDNNTSTDSSNAPFNHPVQSVFKTIVMLTGEFDSGSINFDQFPVTGKLIFTAFVFTIAIILLNLLNGLAVSDTQMIKNDAEIVGYIARIQFITNIESMLTGNILIVQCAQKLFDKCFSLPFHRDWNNRLGQYLARTACICPKYFDYELSFYPGQNGLIDSTSIQTHLNSHFFNAYLDRKSIQGTNNIIQEKRNEIIRDRDNYIKRLENGQELLNSKIDRILKFINPPGENTSDSKTILKDTQ